MMARIASRVFARQHLIEDLSFDDDIEGAGHSSRNTRSGFSASASAMQTR